MTEQEKTFVIPSPNIPLTVNITTIIDPLSLAIAKETGQLRSLGEDIDASPSIIRLAAPGAFSPPNSSYVLSTKHLT